MGNLGVVEAWTFRCQAELPGGPFEGAVAERRLYEALRGEEAPQTAPSPPS